jgi:ribonuclease HII
MPLGSDPPEAPKRDQLAEYKQLRHSKALILGADECGLGSWAGPLVVCAAVVKHDWRPPWGLNDSKKVRANKREDLFEWMKTRVPYAIAMAQSDEIDRQGVMLSLRRCYREAVNSVLAKFQDSLVVIDGEVKIPEIDHLHFPKADGIVPAVMAASIIGKVLHDRYMWQMAEKYPGYSFHRSSGYGTKEHREAIDRLGLCPIHRRSYIPIKKAERLQSEEGICLDSDLE